MGKRKVLNCIPPETEKQFADKVVALAQLTGWRVYRTWISIRSPAGFPDLVLAKPGRKLIIAELKSERGRLTPAQREWLELLKQVQGIDVYIWRPSDWKVIESVLVGG
jgi:NMD protein affecting ribosome stability and mRNA decay